MTMKLVYANVGLLLAVAVMILGTPITTIAQGVSQPMQAYSFAVVVGSLGDSPVGDHRYCQVANCTLRAPLSLPSGVTVTNLALDGCFSLDFPFFITASLWKYPRTLQQGGAQLQILVTYAHDFVPGCFRIFNSNTFPEIIIPDPIDNDNN